MTAATATRTRKVSLVKKAPKVRKVAVLNDCACQRLGLDCTRSTKGTWAPGHDARAKGYLQAAHRDNRPVFLDGVEMAARQAAEEIAPAVVGMLYYKRGSMQARFADDDAAMADSAKSFQIRVGRWTYNALVAGDVVTYVTKSGEAKTLPLAEANIVTP
ncbi:MAG: hypothetical protein VM34scaffold347_67 [Phage 66_12]|jgi:hypothetical protein|nr:MAG: hypothetical protein VM34scaffold347_67 [Phage 66_12]